MILQLAKGVRDIEPPEQLLKNRLIASLQKLFELYGYMPLETPIIERYETLAAKGGAEEDSDCLRETFRFQDQGKRDLGLRFELTTSLARYITQNPSLKLPFKRYEIGKVFRDGPIKLGRYREFYQCDIDIVGSSSMLCETELILMTANFFRQQSLDVLIKINNRKLLDGIFEQIGITDTKEALIALDKLNKIGTSGVSRELLEKGYQKKQILALWDLIRPNIELFQLDKKITSAAGKQGLSELKEIFSSLQNLNTSNIVFDISLARGQAYYTGTVFEAYLSDPGAGEPQGSLAGGGRYDDMISKFAGSSRQIPAVGISFGLEPIADTLRLKDKSSKRTSTTVLVLPIATLSQSLNITQQLRQNNISSEISLIKKGVTKGLEYASSLDIPYVLIIGDKELSDNLLLLRDMNSGIEQRLPLAQIISRLQQ